MVWFRFHNRAEARRWAGLPRFRPKLVWQGADPDLHPQHPGPSSSSTAAADAARSQSGGEQGVNRAIEPSMVLPLHMVDSARLWCMPESGTGRLGSLVMLLSKLGDAAAATREYRGWGVPACPLLRRRC